MDTRQDLKIRSLVPPAKVEAVATPAPARSLIPTRNDFTAVMRRVEAEVYDAA